MTVKATWYAASTRPTNEGLVMLLLLALLVVLLLFGAGFAIHFLWILAVIFAVVWVVGFALSRGESSGAHRFSRR
jgi:predicted RND superfamily exporter protein